MGFVDMNKELIVKKCIPSLVLFILGFVIGFLFLQDYTFFARIRTSFTIGWLAGGFIWGWSLTKSWFPNFSWSEGFFGGVLDTVGSVIRIVTAFVVGSVALPVSIILAIVATAKIGKEAYDKAYNEAVSGTGTEAVKNSQENTSTEQKEI